MNFLYTVPVYRIGDTIEINRNRLGEFYPYYDKLFNIYGIPMAGFKNGRMLEEYADVLFHITYIVPHPETGSPIYVVNKDGVTFLLKHDAILRVFCHSDSQEDDTYTNLLHAAEKMGEYEKEVEYLNKKIKELEEELKEYKPNPIPELKAGMFGKVYDDIAEESLYFVITTGDNGLIMVYKDGEYDDVEDFDAYGKARSSNNSITAKIVTLYSPRIKSFRMAQSVDQSIDSEKDILWKI